MKQSINNHVQEFINDIQMSDLDKFEILMKSRDIVFSCNPKTQERIMYGGIMFSLSNDFGGLFIRKKHVSFEFITGILIKDPDRILEGTGKFRRHLKLRTLKDIEDKKVMQFVEQAVKVL